MITYKKYVNININYAIQVWFLLQEIITAVAVITRNYLRKVVKNDALRKQLLL